MTLNREQAVSATVVLRVSLTIPANASAADTLASLSGLAAAVLDRVIGVKVLGLDTAGASRAAMIAGDSAGSLRQFVLAGADYYEPAMVDHRFTFLKAAAGGSFTAVVVFYLTGPA